MELPSIFDEKTVERKYHPSMEMPPKADFWAGLEGAAWVLVILAAGFAMFVLVTGMMSASGAPQEAVVCALACAIVILPYCAARGVAHLRRLDEVVGQFEITKGLRDKRNRKGRLLSATQ
jgi:hypothetical protein